MTDAKIQRRLAYNELCQAIRRDREKLDGARPEAIRAWFDTFDPCGNYGRELFEKALLDITGIKIEIEP